ncbi:hypothetical protein [Glaciimonas immobilis]|uniref:Uncharacterized protein n=1 Tax=Glaciimonas immobilis TaxID=728004 RepID=A0A840RYT2_9BURK|nr:hypothetical protein [Glaciimonas immobilis]KAF3997236.1 hypothetical protein HAV38_16425 [Glaciimonas immobilis]MBB5202288.1 hypothetical protein [Glaciimonas immobilis]
MMNHPKLVLLQPTELDAVAGGVPESPEQLVANVVNTVSSNVSDAELNIFG